MPADTPPPFHLYDTLTNGVVALEPTQATDDGTPHLRFYSCGPTVYSYAHIGNFRTFLTADLIVRTARALGWRVTYVTNVTDVGHLTEDDVADAGGEDKMAKALQREGQRFANIYDLARHYTETLIEDWQRLNMVEPDVRPRATEHVTDQIEAVERLLASGHAYETSNAVYFSVASFPEYGKLSNKGQDADALEGTREVVQDAEKRDPRDFALWKKDPKHLMQWYSPFGADGGRGFPGWHIECSVMAMRYLGDTLDLHAGGEDLIFPHHECEIAQSEALTGRPFARVWAHTRFLQVEGERMSKSKGNFYTVRQLLDGDGQRPGVDPLALRLALISGQYRKPLNFTFDHLKTSARHIQRFRDVQALVAEAVARDAEGEDVVGPRLDALYARARAAMCDDLNTPEALAALIEGTKLLGGAAKHLSGAAAQRAQAWLEQMNALLGVLDYDAAEAATAAEPEVDPLAQEVEALLQERKDARANRDFTTADAIRDRLDAMGIEVMDNPEGTTWRRKL